MFFGINKEIVHQLWIFEEILILNYLWLDTYIIFDAISFDN